MNNTALIDFGDNLNLVIPLFAGLDNLSGATPSNPNIQEQVLAGVERSQIVGAITPSQADTYDAAVNQLRSSQNLPALFPNNFDLTTPLSPEAQTNINNTKSDLKTALINVLKDDITRSGYGNGTLSDEQAETTAIINDLYTGNTNEQSVKIDSLFSNNDALGTNYGNLWESFVDDLNMIRIYKGLPPL